MLALKVTKHEYKIRKPTLLEKIFAFRRLDLIESIEYNDDFNYVFERHYLHNPIVVAFHWAFEYSDASMTQCQMISKSALNSLSKGKSVFIKAEKGDRKRILKIEVIG